VQEKEEEKDQGNEFCLKLPFQLTGIVFYTMMTTRRNSLYTAIIQNPLPDKIIVTTHKQNVLSSSPINSSNLEPCNHEEADSRIFVHVLDAIKQGHSKIMICTVDTDVVILAIAAISVFAECYNNATLEL